MPYIDPRQREVLGTEGLSCSAGEVAYIAYREALHFLKHNYGSMPTYSQRIQAYGILAGVAAEFYRNHVAPYEDEAKQRNGDVIVG